MDNLQDIRNYFIAGTCLLAVVPLLFCFGAWVGTSPGLRRLFRTLIRQFRSLSPFGKLMTIMFVLVFGVKASTKTNNAPPRTSPPSGIVFDGGHQRQIDGEEALARRLTTNQFLACFALFQTLTNASFALSVPSNAVSYAPWTRYGVAEDTLWLPATNWSFILGTNQVEGLHVSSSGTLSFGWPKGSPRAREMPDGSELDFLAPLQTDIGIVPPIGRFWHAATPSNSLLLTWHDVFANRDTNYPISFKSELFANGDFTFRYDLSRHSTPDARLTGTNFVVGAQNDGGGETYAFGDTNRLVNGLELRWRAFGVLDPRIDDHDGDGLSTYNEVMIYGTDPRVKDSDLDGVTDGAEVDAGSNPMLRDTDGDGLVDGSDPDPLHATSLADADGDGIPDAYEIWRFGSTNVVHAPAADITTNGFLLATEIAAGLDPHAPAPPLAFPVDNLAVWQLCGPFAATFAAATNLVYERTFKIDRSGGWQQYFVSSASHAPAGWSLEGMILEWQDSGGSAGTATASPGDSLWLPLSTNGPATLTLRLRRTTASILCPQPLYLLVWAPGISLTGGIQACTNGAACTVLDLNTGDTLTATFDRSNRPCHASPSSAELGATANPFASSDAGLDFIPSFGDDGAAFGGTLSIQTPGSRDLPQPVPASAFVKGGGGRTTDKILLAIAPVLTWGDGLHGLGGCGERLYYNPATGETGEIFEYPLDSGCLWRNWWRDSTGGYTCNCQPHVSLGEASLNDWFHVDFTYPEADHVQAAVTLGGTFIWSDEAWHQTNTDSGCSEHGVELLSSDECDDCSGCENGNCDGFEGPQPGSLAFRIPLGTPRQGQVSGFLWFRTDEPLAITPAVFNLSMRSDATLLAESNNVGQAISHVNCTDERGRDLRIATMDNGVRIVVSNALCTILEHTWEITNEGGSSGQIRLRKISRIGNTMSDHTYTCDSGEWTCFDNIAQASETITKTGDLNDPENNTLREDRVIRDAGGTVLSRTIVDSLRFGNGETAVLRETARYEKAHGAENWKISHADYWIDTGNPRRNGRPKLIWGDDRPWRYQTWDERGRETLRLDQLDGSAFPGGALFSDTPLTLENLPDGIVCTATVLGYTPHASDSNHSDDFNSPRTVTVHLVRDGAATVISRAWQVYAHGVTNGTAAVTVRTIRACSATATMNDPGNAVSSETVFHSDAPGVPLLLRGRPAASTDENGMTTTYDYTFGSWDNVEQAFLPVVDGAYLRTITRRSHQSHPSDTSQLTIQDANHGVTLHSATLLAADDTALDWQTHAYDDKNRLRSTRYADGSSSTNAYSCCRLLWTMDRDGNKILRSALTGKDRLYYAIEEVSLAELPHDDRYVPYDNWISTDFNAFRVTQHFMDALGRETNTVVRPAKVEGAAVDANFVYDKGWLTSKTTAYPDGTSDYSVRADMRGVQTVTTHTSHADREVTETQTFSPTNPVNPVILARNTYYRNGASESYREWDDQWTKDTRLTEHDAAGCRIDNAVTESSDCGTVTNSVTVCDFLGRAVATVTPLGVTSNFYDGASMRILTTTRTGQPPVQSLYNTLGEQIGSIVSGITNRTDVSYETVAGEVWRVTDSLAGATHSVTRERLTGLSDALRRHTVATGANGVTNEVAAVWNEATRTLAEAQTSSLRVTPAVLVTKYGRMVSETSVDGGLNFFFDPYGRVFYTERRSSGSATWLSETWLGFNDFGDVAEHDTFIGSGSTYAITSYAFDAFGRTITTTDALGNAVTNAYDTIGRRISISGATYPVDHAYDTQGRLVGLITRYGASNAEAQTRWTYDTATGLRTAKTYADDSTIAYACTVEGRPTRTTWARGAWREYSFNTDGLLTATSYGDGTPAGALAYDALQRLAAASNTVAAFTYVNDALGAVTNETITVGTNIYNIVHAYDGFYRPSALAVGGAAVHYAYDAESRLAAVSNDVFLVSYADTPDGLDAGWTVIVTNGTTIARTLTRDTYRRSLVTAITNSVNDVPVNPLAYSYDALNRVIIRNADAFDYNARSEVTSASIDMNDYAYAYDNIGNCASFAISAPLRETFYTANALNQYTNILCASAPPREILPSYDADGNLLTNGVWSYTWDAENRMTGAASNGVPVVTSGYDPQHRRVVKTTPLGTTVFLYDGWLPVLEKLIRSDGSSEVREHVWGKDFSGTMQGAGGVGGLLATRIGGTWYFPLYDANGNITDYINNTGANVAHRAYDAFGNTNIATGPMVNDFNFWFSTKYLDHETGLYYYGYRFYSPELMRWANRDPIAEEGGINLYAAFSNDPISKHDILGKEASTGASVNYEGKPISMFANYVKWRIDVGYSFGRYPIWFVPEMTVHAPATGGSLNVPLKRSRRIFGGVLRSCWTVSRLRVQAEPEGLQNPESSFLFGNRQGDNEWRFWHDDGPRRPNRLRYKPEVRFDISTDGAYNYGEKFEWTRPGTWYDVWWIGGTKGVGTPHEFFRSEKDYSLVPYGLNGRKTTISVSAKVSVLDSNWKYQSVNAFENFHVRLGD